MTRPRPSEDRAKMVSVRLSADERATLEAAAEAAGLTLSGYIRRVLLAAPALRKARRPPVEKTDLARILAHLGKMGSE